MGKASGFREVGLVAAVIAVDLVAWGGDNDLRWGGALSTWVIPTSTLLCYGTLLRRWRHTVPIFWLQWSYGLMGLLVPDYQPFAGLLVALHSVARTADRRIASTALIATAAPFAVDAVNAAAATTEHILGFIAAAFLWVALSLTVWGFGSAAQAAELRAESEKRQQEREAVRSERLRLARDLHDIVAHALTGIILQAAGARTLLAPPDDQVRRTLGLIESAGVDAMQELHQLLGLLRDEHEETYGDTDHPRTLMDLTGPVNLARASGLDITVTITGDPQLLEASADVAGYRVVQESLTNAVKYSAAGSKVSVDIAWRPDVVDVSVVSSSDSPGRGDLAAGYGLRGLVERVDLAGGSLDYDDRAQEFRVHAHLPVRHANSRSVHT